MKIHLNFDPEILLVDIIPADVWMHVYVSPCGIIIVNDWRQRKILSVLWQVDNYDKSV